MLLLIIPMMASTLNSSSQNAFELRSQTSASVDVRFMLPTWNYSVPDISKPNQKQIRSGETPNLFIDEEETLPIFTTTIAVPYSGGVDISVLNTNQQLQGNIELSLKNALNEERKAGRYTAEHYPENYIRISEPMVIRDMRVVTVNIYPFQYRSQADELTINQSIDFRLTFNNMPSVNEIEPPTAISRSFERIYKAMILNYDSNTPRYVNYQAPVMLVIYGNYSDVNYIAKVNEYIAWKKQKGYIVYSASTSVTGTSNTAIKTYIQNAYNTWADRPEHIVLIGDVSGTIAVPTYTYSGSEGDYQYTWLAGGDILGDVFIGRISVANYSDMEIHVAKVMAVDKNINTSQPAWLNTMLLVGDQSSSGISTVYTNKYIKELSFAVNPNYSYTEVYSSPFNTQMNTALNSGVSFFNYRGYIGMSGWSPPSSPLNGNKLYHAVIITCSTGSFAGTSTTETVVRSGTAAGLGGGITAIGMATSSTHTPMNNCLDQGIFHGIYAQGFRNMGESLLYAKLYLNSVYGISNPTQAQFFAQMCNLIGDPTASVYIGVPNTFLVTAPSSINAGTTALQVTVRNSGSQIVPGAVVTLTNSSTLHLIGMSDENGNVLFDLPSNLTGTINLTVNKDDFKPASTTISISTLGGILYESMYVDDGYGGVSSGNGDGVPNSGETIELWVSLRNTGSMAVAVSGTASCTDSYINVIDGRVIIDRLTPGTADESTTPVIFSIAPNCPDNHRVMFKIADNTAVPTWILFVPLTIRNGKIDILSHTFVGAPSNRIYPGDQYPMTFSIKNNGLMALNSIDAILRSHSPFLSIQDSLASFGNIAVNGTVNNSSDAFSISVSGQAITGMIIPLELYLYNSLGFSESLLLSVEVGLVTQSHPLGQDAYGYFIFDQSDTSYPQCPSYSWIGIAPAEGGSGTALNLTDPGSSSDEGDQVGAVSIQTVNLPFPFKFYGVTYTQASISSNGFIAMGVTTNSDWRNWRLPGPGGPNPMIAVFWDDLQLNAGSHVYTYYNAAQHYYVVEWYNVINGYDRVTPETFQAILYDPVYYPTLTGDGQIKLQYKVFNNIDMGSGDAHPHGNYATIGIKDQAGLVGLEYTFNNTYPTAARPLNSESAIFITTAPVQLNSPYIMMEQFFPNDANANGLMENGEAAAPAIRLGNIGSQNATNVSATISTTDPYVTITTASAQYGTIAASSNAMPLSNFGLNVANNCPNAHAVDFNLAITSNEGSWNYVFTQVLSAPALAFGNMTIYDPTGNNNGRIDPGETVTLNINLNNSGGSASVAGTANLSCSTPGVTINTGTANFTALAAGGSSTLSFNVSISSAMSIGTVITFQFNATAGVYSASSNVSTTAGIILEGFETGDFSSFPWTFSGNLPWVIDTTAPYAGTYVAKSGGISDNQTSTMQTIRVLSTSGQLTFWYKVSSEANYDYLRFYIDGVQQNQWAGNVPWTQASYTLAAGTRTLAWTYYKDGSVASGSDCVWVDNIIFPASTHPVSFYPPNNVAATPSHQSVKLDWEAPVSGTPTGYKVFRNGSLLTTVTALTYTDTAVTNGTFYSYYLKAVYSGGESDPSQVVNATPNAVAPSNLVAVPGSGSVLLSWTAASGRTEFDSQFSLSVLESSMRNSDRAISGYKVYRNSVSVATVTTTSYQDTGLTNGATYSYYVTTVYANPAGESSPSNTVEATPVIQSFVVLGTGTQTTSTSTLSPINLTYKSIHGQSVYTATELNAAGVTGPIYITQLGFYVVTLPNLALPSFTIRLKHTSSSNAAAWHSATDLQTVYQNASYMPTAGGYDMLLFDTPFLWNGVDNILIDTAFGLVAEWSHSGTLRYTSMTSGYRRVASDDQDMTNVFSGGNSQSFRPNVRLGLQDVPVSPEIVVSPSTLTFGSVMVNSEVVRQFTIENTGDQLLTGTITTPNGYTVSIQRITSPSDAGLAAANGDRNTLNFAIEAETEQTFQVVFNPQTPGTYNGNIVISSNAANSDTETITITGSAFAPNLETPIVVIAANGGNPMLSWQSVQYADEYWIYRCDTPGGTFTQIGTTTGLTYQDASAPEKAFYYVKAVLNTPSR